MWLRDIIPGIVLNSTCKIMFIYSTRLAETLYFFFENDSELLLLCAHIIAVTKSLALKC